jgi:hypothetical protein
MEDLIKGAERTGFSATPRMVQDWVELGLLGQPERHGLGRGKGVSATWSENQRGLFLTLLDHRQRVGRVAVLANIPVWTWLYFGDSYVELRQVRRALKTWSEPNMRLSITAARQAARQLLEDVNHPKARRHDRKVLLDVAADMFFHGSERLNKGALVLLVRRVMDPKGRGVARTLGAMEYTPEAIVDLLRVRLKALEALEDGAVDDSLFHWARFTNAVSRARYQWLIAQRTTAGGTVAEARVPTMGAIAPRACLDLVTLLGLGLGMPAGAVSVSLKHPDVWRRQNLRSAVHGSRVANSVEVRVEVRPAEEGEKNTQD